MPFRTSCIHRARQHGKGASQWAHAKSVTAGGVFFARGRISTPIAHLFKALPLERLVKLNHRKPAPAGNSRHVADTCRTALLESREDAQLSRARHNLRRVVARDRHLRRTSHHPAITESQGVGRAHAAPAMWTNGGMPRLRCGQIGRAHPATRALASARVAAAVAAAAVVSHPAHASHRFRKCDPELLVVFGRHRSSHPDAWRSAVARVRRFGPQLFGTFCDQNVSPSRLRCLRHIVEIENRSFDCLSSPQFQRPKTNMFSPEPYRTTEFSCCSKNPFYVCLLPINFPRFLR